jgi:surface polysaccharide O-acyltransferase-like enzyme
MEMRKIEDLVRIIGRLFFSILFTAMGYYLITKSTDTASQKFGYTLLGMVAGYWIR